MKIFCVGRNYVAHAKELGNQITEEPVVFLKPKSALHQQHIPFYYPEFTNQLDYECEVVLRISKNGKYISERHASSCYDAVTVGIDFTARDLQTELKSKGLPWEISKAFDSSAILGKWFPIVDFKNKHDINFALYKNKDLVQQGHTSKMIFSFDRIIAYISNYFSINIGDVIFTGTPAGVGEVVVGDELEGFIDDYSAFVLEVK